MIEKNKNVCEKIYALVISSSMLYGLVSVYMYIIHCHVILITQQRIIISILLTVPNIIQCIKSRKEHAQIEKVRKEFDALFTIVFFIFTKSINHVCFGNSLLSSIKRL